MPERRTWRYFICLRFCLPPNLDSDRRLTHSRCISRYHRAKTVFGNAPATDDSLLLILSLQNYWMKVAYIVKKCRQPAISRFKAAKLVRTSHLL